MDIVAGIGLIASGVFIGIISGLLGIGGGTVMVPLLRLVFGLPAIGATATSLFTIIPTSVSGAATHVRKKTCIPALGVALGIGGGVTSALGVYLGSISPSWAIMLVAALVIVYSAFNMVKKALKIPRGQSRHRRAGESEAAAASGRADGGSLATASGEGCPSPARDGGNRHPGQRSPLLASALSKDPAQNAVRSTAHTSTPAYSVAPAPQFVVTKKALAGGFGIGLIAGLASGYVGVGGGFIMVPLMTSWLSVPMHMASGTSLIAILILAIPGVVEQFMLGNVDLWAGILLAVGSIPGATIGARFVTRIPERQLRFIFAGFLAIAAVLLVVKEATIG